MALPGVCKISTGDDNYLTELNGSAAVGLGAETEWEVKVIENEGEQEAMFILILKTEDGGPQRVLTLALEPDSGFTNISVSELQGPPSHHQKWMLNQAMTTKRFPPLAIARIQSVAKPFLYVAIGGSTPLPRTHMSVAAVEQPDDDARWKLDYIMM